MALYTVVSATMIAMMENWCNVLLKVVMAEAFRGYNQWHAYSDKHDFFPQPDLMGMLLNL
jgi:hypothetical protein